MLLLIALGKLQVHDEDWISLFGYGILLVLALLDEVVLLYR